MARGAHTVQCEPESEEAVGLHLLQGCGLLQPLDKAPSAHCAQKHAQMHSLLTRSLEWGGGMIEDLVSQEAIFHLANAITSIQTAPQCVAPWCEGFS